MSRQTLALVAALVGLLPRVCSAQSRQQPTASGDDRFGANEQATPEQLPSLRLLELQAELDARPLKAAVIVLAVSGALTLGGIMTAALYRNGENESVPALWALPGIAGAGVIAGGVALGVRQHQRRPFTAERRLLLRRARMDGAGAASPTPRVSSSRRWQLGPALLIGLGAAAFGATLVTGILMAVAVADARDHGERGQLTAMRVTFGMLPVGAALAIGGGVWLALRKRQRRSSLPARASVESGQHGADMWLSPYVAASSLGLRWSGRF